MISKKTALKEAGRFAAALEGPFGRRPMQGVVTQFLPLFRDLRASGAGWAQIAALLASAGVRSRSGQPLNAAVVRAMVSRAKREHLATIGDSPAADDRGRQALADSKSPPVQRPWSARQRKSANAGNPAFEDVAERIRRASVLRAKGGADRG